MFTHFFSDVCSPFLIFPKTPPSLFQPQVLYLQFVYNYGYSEKKRADL